MATDPSLTRSGYFSEQSQKAWTEYVIGRPTYPPTFYEEVLAYHRDVGNNAWSLLHDIACGPGNVTEALLPKFKRVVASDMIQAAVDAAEAAYQNASRAGSHAAEFVVAKGEDVASMPRADRDWNNRTDMVIAAECITLMDSERSLDCFARLLRPGGTLAVWFYGRPTILENDGSVDGPRQQAFDKLIAYVYAALGGLSVPASPDHLRGLRYMSSWLEYLRLDTPPHAGRWRNVRRVHWNSDRPMSLVPVEHFNRGQSIGREPMPAEQAAFETIEHKIDRQFWGEDWDEERLFEFVLSLRPTFRKDLAQADEEFKQGVEKHRAAVQEAMLNSKQAVTWPVTLLQAVRS